MTLLSPQNPRLLERLSPFVVATAEHQEHFDLRPFGLEIQQRFDPLKSASGPFLELLRHLDGATFGPEGMPMPRWVFFDGAELPGGIVGFGANEADLLPSTREAMKVKSGSGQFVPLAMFIAIPTHEQGIWMAHNLASMAPQLPEEGLAGLGGLTKAVGLKTYRARRQIGATQWNSSALSIHTRLGPLELLSAWTPAHSEAWTLTYGVTLSDAVLKNLARDADGEVERPAVWKWIDSEDHVSQRELQARIEAGERLCIANKPESLGADHLRVPVARLL